MHRHGGAAGGHGRAVAVERGGEVLDDPLMPFMRERHRVSTAAGSTGFAEGGWQFDIPIGVQWNWHK